MTSASSSLCAAVESMEAETIDRCDNFRNLDIYSGCPICDSETVQILEDR
jgi:hypothetical protein